MRGSKLIQKLDLLNHIQDGIIVIDTEGTILYWNSVCQEIFGYTLDEIAGNSMKILHLEDDPTKFEKLLEKCTNKETYCETWHAKNKENNRIWLDIKSSTFEDEANGKQYCIITVNNIEHLESIKRDLKKITALEETILETSADAIITANKDGKILSFNRAAVQMFGHQKDDIIGKDIQILIPSFYFKRDLHFSDGLNGNINSIMRGEDIHMYGKHKNGRVFHIGTSVSNVPWNGERILVAIIRDLTQKRDLEKRMISIANEERRRIGRELHDGLGQMLTGIRMVAENLARKLKANEIPGADEVQEISEMVREADEHARAISRGLVEVHLVEKGLSNALDNLTSRIVKTFGIDCVYTGSGQIEFNNHTNALQIYRIVQEAVMNAVRHAEASHIRICLSKNESNVVITIEDDGIGFESGKGSREGSGIKIMNYRADLLGGTIDIYRTDDHKTVVKCIIPNEIE